MSLTHVRLATTSLLSLIAVTNVPQAAANVSSTLALMYPRFHVLTVIARSFC